MSDSDTDDTDDNDCKSKHKQSQGLVTSRIEFDRMGLIRSAKSNNSNNFSMILFVKLDVGGKLPLLSAVYM